MAFNPREIYLTFDDPIPFKNGLMLYPVSLRKYYEFFFYSQCLMLEKNSIRDPMLAMKAISMTYLEYLEFVSLDSKYNDENPSPLSLFFALLRLCMRLPEETKYKFGHKKEDGKPVFIINENSYDSNDFDLLREIVAEQNELELPDERIQKDVRDAMEEARRERAKINGQTTAGLEDQIIALSVYTGLDIEQIYKFTIRKFHRMLKRADHILHQKIYLGASLSGMVEFKDKSFIKSWLANIDDEDKTKDVTTDLESIENKVSMKEAMGKGDKK